MTETTDIPNFGALLAPILGQVSAADRPRFLALLERTAADRYRGWAAALPAHGDVLLSCAAAEDEIADRIEAAFGCAAESLDQMHRILPEARDIYYRVFESMPVTEQLRLQAAAELQGAAAWRHVAERLADDDQRDQRLAALAACSALEERSSQAVTELLAAIDPDTVPADDHASQR